MNELKIFENPEFGTIRTVEIKGEPWLVGKDVAEALGYSNPRDALATHVDDEDKATVAIHDGSQNRNMTAINESGLYSLVLSSKLPGAKQFRRWVTAEVLPSIRKHGAYMTPETIEKVLTDPDTIIQLATALKEERQKRKALETENTALTAENEVQRQAIADFQPIKQYVDTILSSNGTMATSQIAADYDMSARSLNKILHEEGIQRNVNGQWILYKEYMGKGYTKSITIPITRSDGRPDTKLHTHWTQKGRLLIHEILTARGIQAVMDRQKAS